MRISSPNVVSSDEGFDEVVHHVVLDGSAEMAVVLKGMLESKLQRWLVLMSSSVLN